MALGRRTTVDGRPLRINVLGNYCSQENSVKVLKIDDSFVALEGYVNNPTQFLIEDGNGIVHRRRLLLNHNGSHIVTLRKKLISLHDRWEAYNLEESVCLFSAKKSWHNTNLDVFLESNDKRKLKVTGTYLEGSFKVQVVNQLSFNIAEMRDGMVIVNPNIDYAFIIALIMIQDALA